MQLEEIGPDDQEPELILPEDFVPGNPFPLDAQRMGFDRYTGGEAGILAIAANLDGRKASHRVFAGVLLILVVGWFAATIWWQVH